MKRRYSGSTKSVEIKDLIREIRLLRNEVALIIPTEDIKGYANPIRIKNSYKKALRQYRPAV